MDVSNGSMRVLPSRRVMSVSDPLVRCAILSWPRYLSDIISEGVSDIYLTWGECNRCVVRADHHLRTIDISPDEHLSWCQQVYWQSGFVAHHPTECLHQTINIAGESVRVSYIPTMHAQHMTLRLHKEHISTMIYDFMSPWQGCVVISGRTGAGKTTLAYQWLKVLSKKYRVLSVEDPPERLCPYVTQLIWRGSQTTKDLLKAVLRQTPDIIFIGEVRDRHAIDLLRNWILTGHAVMTTIHAASPQSTWLRMRYLGFPVAEKETVAGCCFLDYKTKQPSWYGGQSWTMT